MVDNLTFRLGTGQVAQRFVLVGSQSNFSNIKIDAVQQQDEGDGNLDGGLQVRAASNVHFSNLFINKFDRILSLFTNLQTLLLMDLEFKDIKKVNGQ